MSGDPLLGIAEELYALVPSSFTGTRNEWAKQTKAEGDKELAARVAALRRPSVAAWVVNAMMRHHADQMQQLLEVGASLRQAAADLDADALRELTRQRRALTTAITRQARALAGELGQKVTEPVADQVQATLHAAMVDEQAAAAVGTGMLVASLASTGVGAADVADAVAVPEAFGLTPRTRPAPPARRPELSVVRAAPETQDQPARQHQEREQREAERKAAREQAQDVVERARSAADEARRKVRKAGKRVERVQVRTLQAAEELEEARRRAAELEHELEQLAGDAETAEDKQERSQQRYAAAQAELDRARTDLDRLP